MLTGKTGLDTAPNSLLQLDHDGQPGPSDWNDHYQHYFEDALYYPIQRSGAAALTGSGGPLNGYQQLSDTSPAQIFQQGEWMEFPDSVNPVQDSTNVIFEPFWFDFDPPTDCSR